MANNCTPIKMKKEHLIINGKIIPFEASTISSIWGTDRFSEFLEICIIEENFDFASENDFEVKLTSQVELSESIEKMITAIVEATGRQKDDLQVCVTKDLHDKKKLYICFGKINVDFFPYGVNDGELAIVIDTFHEFELSDAVLRVLDYDHAYYRENRTDPELVKVVYRLGSAASKFSMLKVVYIPKKYENDWEIIPLSSMNDPAGETVVYSKSPSPPLDWYVRHT